jgi:glutaredoxin
MILLRLIVVVSLLVLFALARRMYFQWRAGLHRESRDVPRLPAELLGGADRTWVVFTTPYCATCEPVKQRLAAHDPDARVVTVDATREPFLAKAFHVRSAPTVLLADGAGDVQARLVGAAAVADYVRSPA